MQSGKKAEDINIIFHSGEKTNTFMIQGNYIMVNGKYYSLGWKGEEKGIQFIDELESIMVDAERKNIYKNLQTKVVLIIAIKNTEQYEIASKE